MLSFLSPLFLAGAAVAAVPLILHLLKREPEPRVKFAAVKLLKDAPIELTQKRRLRELLLLTLRVAALVLLALAFARPFFASGAALGSGGTTIVALDMSYSMTAPGVFDRARRLAKEAVDRAPDGDQVGVLGFADTGEMLAAPSADRALARAAIDRASPGYGSTRYRVGLNAAAEAIGFRRGTIVVVTDLQESGWDAGDRASVSASIRIEIADLGAPPPNLAVTSIASVGDRVVATIRNTDRRMREAHVRLRLDDRPAAEMTISVGAGSSADAALAAPGRASLAEVSVDDPDGLQADNVRYAVLDAASRPSVLVVTATGDVGREAFYVQQALAAGGGYQVVGVGGAQLAGWDEARLAPHSAVFLLSTRGLERRGREALASYVRSGGGMLVAAGPDIDGEVAAGVLGAGSALRIEAASDPRPAIRTLAPADIRHPIFQPFGDGAATLGLVRFRDVVRIGGSECQTIARFTSGEAALVDCGAGDGRAMVLASDLNNKGNDFPLHPTFVAFLHEAVRYLGSARALTNDYLIGNAPANIPTHPGVATLADGGRTRRVAVNVDPREGDPARVSADEFQAAVTRLMDVASSEARVEAVQQEERQQMWRYVMALVVAALALEGIVASRTS